MIDLPMPKGEGGTYDLERYRKQTTVVLRQGHRRFAVVLIDSKENQMDRVDITGIASHGKEIEQFFKNLKESLILIRPIDLKTKTSWVLFIPNELKRSLGTKAKLYFNGSLLGCVQKIIRLGECVFDHFQKGVVQALGRPPSARSQGRSDFSWLEKGEFRFKREKLLEKETWAIRQNTRDSNPLYVGLVIEDEMIRSELKRDNNETYHLHYSLSLLSTDNPGELKKAVQSRLAYLLDNQGGEWKLLIPETVNKLFQGAKDVKFHSSEKSFLVSEVDYLYSSLYHAIFSKIEERSRLIK